MIFYDTFDEGGKIVKKIGMLIMIIAIIGQIYSPFMNYTTSFKNEGKEVNLSENRALPKNGCQLTNNTVSKSSINDQTQNLNFTNLSSYLLGLQFPDGGFQIKRGSQSYMNATYFASISLRLIGEGSSAIKNDITSFLNHTFITPHSTNKPELIGGFKNWLEGKPSIKSTAFAVLTSNAMNNGQQVYNNSTITFLQEKIQTLNLSNIPLLDLAVATLTLKGINQTFSLENAISTIKERLWMEKAKKYNTKEKREKMLANYFSTLLLKRIQGLPESINVTQTIKSKYNSSIGGFGWSSTDPTVFQTGLALEVLSLVNDSISSSIKRGAFNFVNRSQLLNGGILPQPKHGTSNIFQVAGALMTYHATQNLLQTYSLKTISPSKQVIIGSDIHIAVSTKFKGETLGGLSIQSFLIDMEDEVNQSLNLYYNSSKEIYEVYLTTLNDSINFGSHKIVSTVMFNWPGLPHHQKNIAYTFRIGFNVSISIPSGSSPGTTIQMNLTVEGPPKYLDVNGTFHYSIVKKESLWYRYNGTSVSNYSTSLSIEWNIPSNASLGYHTVKVRLGDKTYGTNHSFNSKSFFVTDEINISKRISDENRSSYYFGETIHIKQLNVSYNESKEFPTEVPAYLVFEWGEKTLTTFWNFWDEQSINISKENRFLNLTLPRYFPDMTKLAGNFTKLIKVSLEIDFGGYEPSVDLFKFNLSLSRFEIANFSTGKEASSNTVFIGNKLNASFKLKDPNTNVSVTKMKVKSVFKWREEIVQTMHANFRNETYFLNQCLTPNLPAKNTSVDFKVKIPWNNSFVSIKSIKMNINVKGWPSIEETEKHVNQKGTPNFLRFLIVNNNSKTRLGKLNLSGNITGKKNFQVPIGIEQNGYYSLSFTPNEARTYRIKIFRVIDSFQLGRFQVTVKEKQEELFGQWRQKLLGGVLFSVIAVYFIVRWKVGKEVSRRWLIEKWREREKKKK